MLHEGESLLEYADYYDYSTSYPEGEGIEADPDAEVEVNRIDDDCFQLVLPSGAKIGHRSLARYYKQSLNPGLLRDPEVDSFNNESSFIT